MRSLRKARNKQRLTLKQMEQVIGINISFLSEIERGLRFPSILTRHRIESMLNEPINWLDVPSLKTANDCKSEWNNVEFDFRQLYKAISGLPEDERSIFIKTAIKHLRNLNTCKSC